MIFRVLKTLVQITVGARIRPQDSRAFCVLILSFTVQVSIKVYKGTARVYYSVQGSVLFRSKPVSELSPFRAPELCRNYCRTYGTSFQGPSQLL
jgi:hypothetical protein